MRLRPCGVPALGHAWRNVALKPSLANPPERLAACGPSSRGPHASPVGSPARVTGHVHRVNWVFGHNEGASGQSLTGSDWGPGGHGSFTRRFTVAEDGSGAAMAADGALTVTAPNGGPVGVRTGMPGACKEWYAAAPEALMAEDKEKCATCYGEGCVSSERGPKDCPDCLGMGMLPSATVLTERRLRELEKSYSERGGEEGRDVGWLVGEVRRAHHVLLQILAASQDADEDDTSKRIKYLANDVLAIYPPRSQA